MSLLPLLLAAQIDGQAALRHASSLAALGPHPWGSPRSRAAAQYVDSQFREAGLAEVRLEEFESHGIRGANVVGVLRAPGPELVVVGAHHDTAPDAPGAYDAGGGVGVLIESARALARSAARPRTLVFVSWDGEEAWSTGRTTTAGSRAFLKGLGARSRDVVAAFAIEMCGWKGGTPVLHPIPYLDPMRPGRSVVTPDWLVAAALQGGRVDGEALRVGDPLIPWLYQPAVRTFRVGLYGDDLSFLQAGVPALFASDSSFTAYYPWYHQASDTADKLDAASLERMGRHVVGVVDALGQVPRGAAAQPSWFAAFGRVAGPAVLWAFGLLSLAPGLARAVRAGGAPLGLRALQAAAVAFLLWRHPVPTLWVFAPPLLLTGLVPGAWARIVGMLPLLALAGLGLAAWLRGHVSGVWLSPLEMAVALAALGAFWFPGVHRRKAAASRSRRPARRR